MLSFLPTPVKGSLSFLLYVFNTLFFCSFLFAVAAFKLVVRYRPVIRQCDRLLNLIATCWIGVNGFNSNLFSRIEWDIRGEKEFSSKEWYLVLSNHQSWVDILVLQKCLNTRIPLLKFFLKKELIWVPVLGLAWWALDFPFMQRHSAAQIRKKPELKGTDLERTRKACKKFQTIPVSVMNFLEGTRFTPQKHASQDSSYQHLLPPKAGGIAFVLGAMGEYLHKIINVTIVYPETPPSFWQYISGQVRKITVDFEILPITPQMIGDYFNDPAFKEKFCSWLNNIWQEKDEKIAGIKAESAATCSSP